MSKRPTIWILISENSRNNEKKIDRIIVVLVLYWWFPREKNYFSWRDQTARKQFTRDKFTSFANEKLEAHEKKNCANWYLR